MTSWNDTSRLTEFEPSKDYFVAVDSDRYVQLIAGQELGSKAEHLELATQGRYEKDRILMIGDVPGDGKAAQTVGVLFYPILPGREMESWTRLRHEGIERFLNQTYAGSYQENLMRDFEACLPERPTW